MISRRQFYHVSLTCHGTAQLLFIARDYYLLHKIAVKRHFYQTLRLTSLTLFSLSCPVIIALVSFRLSAAIIVACPIHPIHIFIPILQARYMKKVTRSR